MNSQRSIKVIFYLSPLMLLSACAPLEWVKEKLGGGTQKITTEPVAVEGSVVLASIDGKPIVTSQMLEEKFNEWLEENPALKQVLPYMPDVKFNFFKTLVNHEMVNKYIEDSGVAESNDYKKDEKIGASSLKQALNYKYFAQAHPVTTSEKDVRDFYEKYKDAIPELLISRGGVNAFGLAFDKEDAARAFLAKAKMSDLTRAARDANMSDKVRDFKFVNAKSVGIDPVLRTKILSFTKFPSYDVVKVGEQYWVVNATNKEETKYRPFEQIKADLEREVEKQRRIEVLEQKINELKKKYGVTENEAYFKQQAQQGMAGMNPADLEQMPEVAQNQQAPQQAQVA